LLPLILLFTLIGAYAINNNAWDIWVMLLFGVIGYLMRKFEYPAAPVVLALVLGPLMETNFRRALALAQGDLTVFVTHPLSAFLLLCAVLSLAWPLLARLVTGDQREVAMPIAEEI
jgi:putative tricarboxylic transport membrane protein